MSINTITDAVRELWDFLWPSVLLAVVLAGTAFYVANDTLRQFALATKSAFTAQQIRRFETALKLVGLKPLVPVISGFAVLFVLFATRNVVESVGFVLPPRLSFEPECVFASTLDIGEIACLRGQVTGSTSLVGYSRIAVLQGRLKASRTDNGEFWRESAAEASALFDIVKFIILWVIAWSVVEMAHRRWSKREVSVLIAIILLCVGAAAVAVGNVIYAKHQQLLDEASVLRSLITPGVQCRPLPRPDITYYAKLRTERWWWFEVGPWVKLEWFIRSGLRGAG